MHILLERGILMEIWALISDSRGALLITHPGLGRAVPEKAQLKGLLINGDYYIGFSLSPDLLARDSNIGPRACPQSDTGRCLIDGAMTKNPWL